MDYKRLFKFEYRIAGVFGQGNGERIAVFLRPRLFVVQGQVYGNVLFRTEYDVP